MFILRIGAEALKISDSGLSKDSRHSKVGKFKSPRNTFDKSKYSTTNHGILYNLLKQRSIPNYDQCATSHNSFLHSVDTENSVADSINNHSIIKSTVPIRASSESNCLRFHPYSKFKPVLLNKSNYNTSLNINPENLIMQWLRNMISILKPDTNGENSVLKMLRMYDCERRKILKQSWHLIFVTYLAEFIQSNEGKIKIILGLLIKDYDKTFDNSNYKKLFRLTRVFTNDLEAVIEQMIELKLSQSLFQLFRVAILLTDRHVDKGLKNIHLLKPLLLCHSKEYYRQFDEVTENLFKLDMIMAESVFCEHLTQSVDKIIDELYSQS